MGSQPCNNSLLLEVNLISAQELHRVAKLGRMQTYAVAWIDPRNRLTSRVDKAGRENPTWNDKFVFVIDEERLSNPRSALEIEIYCVRRLLFKDERIGIVRILIEELLREGGRRCEGIGATFMAFQVRRPSGRPQGILNIGAMVLDGLPYQVMSDITRMSPAVGYRELMGREEISSKETSAEATENSSNMGEESCFSLSRPLKNGTPKETHQWPPDDRKMAREKQYTLADALDLVITEKARSQGRITKQPKHHKTPHYMSCI